jgi:hypothetical protein
MKRGIAFLLLPVLALALSACGGQESHSQTAGQSQSVSQVLEETIEQQTAPADSQEPGPEVQSEEQTPEESGDDLLPGDYVVDLPALGSTMVYAEVSAMMLHPEDYVGKSVRRRGAFAMAEGDGRNYYACFIADAAACCAQGIEFVLEGEDTYPEGYPQDGEEITVTGIFDTYYEGQTLYCQLIHAEMAF